FLHASINRPVALTCSACIILSLVNSPAQLNTTEQSETTENQSCRLSKRSALTTSTSALRTPEKSPRRDINRTLTPSSRRPTTNREPIKPAPPVTKTLIHPTHNLKRH